MHLRLGWLFAAFSATLVACSGGGSNNDDTPAACGNGVVDSGEQCDDGNVRTGDGCSAVCETEDLLSCGNGMVNSGETCDDGNTTSGDGCSSTCQSEGPPVCGDNKITPPETCDDGNTTGGDGCSSMCTLDAVGSGTCTSPYVVAFTTTAGVQTFTRMGDTTSSTDQVGVAECDGFPSGAGKDHVYKFTIAATSDVEITTAMSGSFDAAIRMLAAPCDVTTEVSEFGTSDGCSDFVGPDEFLFYVAIPAGTYYVVVDGYDDAEEGTYALTIRAKASVCGNGTVDQLGTTIMFPEQCDDGDTTAGDGCNARCEVEDGFVCAGSPSVCAVACGNGMLDGLEGCDDGNTMATDGCSATCEVEPGFACDGEPSVCGPSCGNGTFDSGEECEDGGLVDGDRCSATCVLESDHAEVEPNDTKPQAQMLDAASQIIRGALTMNDVDLYTFTLTAPARVDIETYDSIDNEDDYEGVGTLTQVDCLFDDTKVFLYDASGDVTMDDKAMYGDDDDGDDYCSYLGPQDSDQDADPDPDTADPNQGILQAGTYTIKVVHYDPDETSERYLLDLKITPTATTRAPNPGDLVLNEIMSADGPGADTNCDGSTTTTADEFVEIYNASSDTLDLSGVTLWERDHPLEARHTFAAGTLLQPGKVFVVWAGGAPNCPGVTNFAVASAGLLSLSDTGDFVTLKSAGAVPVTLVTTTFPAQDPAMPYGISWNLSPDVTGSMLVKHNTLPVALGNYSPGKRADGTAF